MNDFDTIDYNGLKYPCRLLEIKDEYYLTSIKQLEDELFFEDLPKDPYAKAIDEAIFFYFDEKDFYKSYNELAGYINKNVLE